MYSPPNVAMFLSAVKIKTSFTYDFEPSKIKEGSGTGFIVNKNSQLYLVTNRHNVDFCYLKSEKTNYTFSSIEANLWLLSKKINNERSGLTGKWVAASNPKAIKFSSNNQEDVAVVKVDMRYDTSVGFSVASFDFDQLATDEDFNYSRPGEPVLVPGYSELENVEDSTPIGRYGTFASIPSSNYKTNGDAPARRIAIEMFSSAGMSGSPVIAFESLLGIAGGRSRRCFVVGVNASHRYLYDQSLSKIHSGISICFKSSVVRELIQSFEVTEQTHA